MKHLEAIDRRCRGWLAVRVLALATLECLAASFTQAQSVPSLDKGAVASRPPLAISPTISLGGSVLWFDEVGDGAFRGIAFRGGVAIGPIAEVTVGADRWPELGPYSAWSLQAEGSMYPLGRTRVAPYLLLHRGYFRATLPPATIYTRELIGGSTGLAAGFHVRVRHPFGVRVEYAVRYEPGGGDEQLRAFVTCAPGLAHAGLGSAEASAVVYGMVRASGPWHFVEPAYAVKFATGVTERDAVALTIAVLHWRISEPPRLLVPYLWDTRAVLVAPAWQRGKRSGDVRWHVQVGPAASLMVEGPDYGLRAGGTAEVGASVRLGPLPRIAAGIGWLWLVRGVSQPSVPPTDERGLLVHAGITF